MTDYARAQKERARHLRRKRYRRNYIGPKPGEMTLQDLNTFRNKQGLVSQEKKHRECLKCEAEFLSDGIHQRLCIECTKSIEYLPIHGIS